MSHVAEVQSEIATKADASALTSLVATRAAASELAQARSDLAATQLIVQGKANSTDVYDKQTVDQRLAVAVAPFRSADLQTQIDSTLAPKAEVVAALAQGRH